MTEESHISEEAAKETLRALFEEEGKGCRSPEELARRVGLEPEELFKALTNPPLIERIHARSLAAVWAAVPAILKALIKEATEGSLPQARYLLEFAGIRGEGPSDASASGEEDEFERLNRDELVDYVDRAVAFARESSP